MSVFSDAFADSFAALLDQYGETITYVSAAGAATQVTAIAHKVEEEIGQDGGRTGRKVRKVTIPRETIDQPAKNATLTIDGAVWSIVRPTSQNEASTVVEAVMVKQLERTSPEYRGGQR